MREKFFERLVCTTYTMFTNSSCYSATSISDINRIKLFRILLQKKSFIQTYQQQYYPAHLYNQQIKIMKRDELIKIDQTLTSIKSDKEQEHPTQSEYSNYCEAIKELKDVHQKIASIKTKIQGLVVKHKKHLFAQKQEQLRIKHLKEQNKRIKQFSNLQVIKCKTEDELRKIIIQNKKLQIAKRVDRAKRINTEDKFLSHDKIREQSIENQKKIEEYKQSLSLRNQIKHNRILRNQSSSRQLHQKLKERNQRKKRQFFSNYADGVYAKIEEKEKQLQKIDNQCKKYERFLRSITQKKQRKMKKIWSARKNFPHLSNTGQIVKSQSHSVLNTIS